jgi:hypothetical protein
LAIIAKEYPEGIDLVLLRRVLANINVPLTHKEIYGYVIYLRDVGYVTTKEVDVDGDELWDILYVTATTKGLNFIDGILTDPDPGVLRV